jgi:hypothetical protein
MFVSGIGASPVIEHDQSSRGRTNITQRIRLSEAFGAHNLSKSKVGNEVRRPEGMTEG